MVLGKSLDSLRTFAVGMEQRCCDQEKDRYDGFLQLFLYKPKLAASSTLCVPFGYTSP